MDNLDNYLEPEQVNKILASIEDQKHYLMITLLWKTGMRISDLITLQYESIDFHNMAINIKYGKGGKSRRVPIDRDSLSLLRSYCSLNNIVYADKLFKMTRQNAFLFIKKYADLVGINNVHPHTFRHSFAVNCIRQGVDVRSLQLWMGHANINTTTVYLQFKDTHMKEMYDKVKF